MAGLLLNLHVTFVFSRSHSGHSGGSVSDSETENEEEFCDTSDEPAEVTHKDKSHWKMFLCSLVLNFI